MITKVEHRYTADRQSGQAVMQAIRQFYKNRTHTEREDALADRPGESEVEWAGSQAVRRPCNLAC